MATSFLNINDAKKSAANTLFCHPDELKLVPNLKLKGYVEARLNGLLNLINFFDVKDVQRRINESYESQVGFYCSRQDREIVIGEFKLFFLKKIFKIKIDTPRQIEIITEEIIKFKKRYPDYECYILENCKQIEIIVGPFDLGYECWIIGDKISDNDYEAFRI